MWESRSFLIVWPALHPWLRRAAVCGSLLLDMLSLLPDSPFRKNVLSAYAAEPLLVSETASCAHEGRIRQERNIAKRRMALFGGHTPIWGWLGGGYRLLTGAQNRRIVSAKT